MIQPGLFAQFWFPVRVGQAAHIEYQVGIDRHAALEPERLHQEGGAWLGLVQQAQLDGVTKLVEVQVGRIDLEVRQIGYRPQQGGLILNGFGQRAIGAAQRMATAGFREALEQGLFVGVQIQYVAFYVPGADFFQ
ncbi:hypothetical protein D3C85_1202370 [compost metagenome]